MDKTGGGIRILMQLSRDHLSEYPEVRNIYISFSRIFFSTKSRENMLTIYVCDIRMKHTYETSILPPC
jgi:hypothetical protein